MAVSSGLFIQFRWETTANQMTLISVAMCTYNGEKFLQEQLDSIAAQSLPPFELVICDDDSTDATAQLVRAFAATAPFSVRFIQNRENLGSTRNFEQAIGLCRGELIALSDQDDVWHPDKLLRLSAILFADPTIGGVFSDAESVDEHTRPTGQNLWEAIHFSPKRSHAQVDCDLASILLKQNVVTGATLMFRANLRSTFLPIHPSWVHDGWIAWMLVSYSRLVPVPGPLMKYRIHPSQQLGVLPTALRSRLARAKTVGREDYLLMARQFEAVRERWISRPCENKHCRLQDLDAKIALLSLRANLPKRRLLRVYRVLRASRAYYKYASGLKSIAKDLSVKRD